MKDFSFNPFGLDAIIVKFLCDKCSNSVESDQISIPAPNYMADTSSDSQVENEGYACCSKCNKEFEIEIMVSYGGGDGNIENLSESTDIEIEEIEEEYYQDEFDAILNNTAFFETFTREINNIGKLLTLEPADSNLRGIFYRQLYSSVIGTMEVYLSDAFINTVLKSKEKLKEFFRTYKPFAKQNIPVSTYFDFEENAEEIAKKAMLGIIYHNLNIVSGMYKDTLGVKFPKYGEILKAINKRHDFVHRNGKDKTGTKVILDKTMLLKLIEDMKDFITEIDNQL